MAHVLIVEDEAFIRQRWGQALDQQGHTWAEAADLLAAVEHLRQATKAGITFDLLLLDHGLGDANGLEVLQYLAKQNQGAAFRDRVIVVTGNYDAAVAQAYMDLGAATVLLKPVTEANLLETVATVLQW